MKRQKWVFASAFLFGSLALIAWAQPASSGVFVPAKEVTGYQMSDSGGRLPLNQCAYRLSPFGQRWELSFLADPAAPSFVDTFFQSHLPLQDAVIPTNEAGVDLRYEEGIFFSKRVWQDGLFERTEKIKLEVDPYLQVPTRALVRIFASGGFPPQTNKEILHLECIF